jgi:hypothetical protein
MVQYTMNEKNKATPPFGDLPLTYFLALILANV